MATRSMPIVSCRPVSIAILTLVPTPSVAATRTGSVKPAALEVEKAAEAADLGVGAGPRGGAHQRLDQFHHAVAGIDVDAGLRVGEALLAPWSVLCPFAASVLGNPVRGNRKSVQWPVRRYTGQAGRAGWRRRARDSRAQNLSIPNLITLARILLVPVVVWAIASGRRCASPSCLFLAAGVSDAVDGFLAKRFGMATRARRLSRPAGRQGADRVDLRRARHPGAHPALAGDPGGVARHHDRQRRHPVLAGRQAGEAQAATRSPSSTPWRRSCWRCLVLASLGFEFSADAAITVLMALVAVLTLLSIAFYLAEWVRHMSEPEPRS